MSHLFKGHFSQFKQLSLMPRMLNLSLVVKYLVILIVQFSHQLHWLVLTALVVRGSFNQRIYSVKLIARRDPPPSLHNLWMLLQVLKFLISKVKIAKRAQVSHSLRVLFSSLISLNRQKEISILQREALPRVCLPDILSWHHPNLDSAKTKLFLCLRTHKILMACNSQLKQKN